MLGWLGLVSIPCFFAAMVTKDFTRTITLIGGVLFFLPLLVYLYIVTIWHWKERYLGTHSDLWGAILLIETSGWFKLLYIFRHIIPDAKSSGRYRERNLLYAVQNVEVAPPTKNPNV